jgi:hypothetical protein
MLIQGFLGQQSVRLAVSQVSRGRADQLRDLMTVLKLRAIDLDYSSRILQQGLGGCLDDASLSGAGRSQEKKVSDRPAGRRESRHVSLIRPHDLVNRRVLSND